MVLVSRVILDLTVNRLWDTDTVGTHLVREWTSMRERGWRLFNRFKDVALVRRVMLDLAVNRFGLLVLLNLVLTGSGVDRRSY